MDSLAHIFAGQLSRIASQRSTYSGQVSEHERRIQEAPDDPRLYQALAACHTANDCYLEACRTLTGGVARCPGSSALRQAYILTLNRSGLTEDAVQAAETAARELPGDVSLRFFHELLLPVIYQSQEEVDRYRRRFAEGLERLRAEVPLDTAADRREALAATAAWSNFYLSYQGRNDLELQTGYGELLHRILAANFPQWAERPEKPGRVPGRKCRVGYVSHYDKAVSRFFLGWLRHAAKDRIEVYCYHLGRDTNPVTEECRAAAAVFRQADGDLEEACRQIADDRLDVLVYPDLGVKSRSCQLAALRLAPVQCAALAHPMTSGLPTVDYFLSSEAMESGSAAEHYSETLVRLPRLGISYEAPVLPRPLLSRTREDFKLRTDGVLYLCCQSLCKYLPRYDYIFAEIARRVTSAQFLFFDEPGRGEVFRRRLAKAFEAVGRSAGDHCVWLPHVDQFTYWNLNLLSDVFLDSIGWSGGNTTIEAIACGLPVVTCPTGLLRGRQSYGMLQVLGVADTAAHSEPEYIEAACRLGLDPAWRAAVRDRMEQGRGGLFGDRECVAALDEFLIRQPYNGSL